MTEIEKAIKHFEGLQKRYTTQHNGAQCELVKTALAALREKAECEKGCEYCNSRFGIAAHHINDAGLQAGTNKIAKFCPMCDNDKCQKGMPQCEAEQWLEKKLKQEVSE